MVFRFPIAVTVHARSTFVKSETMLGIVETEEKSQKDIILTSNKTIWIYHKSNDSWVSVVSGITL